MVTVSGKHGPLSPVRGGAKRRAASWGDVPVALAATALTMAALILVATFTGENVAGGEAGRFWALVFAGGLGLCGLFLSLLGFALRSQPPGERGHIAIPTVIGVATGTLVGSLLVDGASAGAVLASLLALLLATPPVRDGLSWLMGLTRRGAGRRGR